MARISARNAALLRRGCYHVQPIGAINVFLILTIHYVENERGTRRDTGAERPTLKVDIPRCNSIKNESRLAVAVRLGDGGRE